jgi:hypothetical protein
MFQTYEDLVKDKFVNTVKKYKNKQRKLKNILMNPMNLIIH